MFKIVIKITHPAKRALKKTALGLGCVALAIGILFAAGWHIPFPIEGNWQPALSYCMCFEHEFMRFEDGKIINMSGHAPSMLFGTYRKTNKGRYELDWFFESDDFPRFVRSTFLRVAWENELEIFEGYRIKRFIRDPFIFTCRRILNDPKNDWLKSTRGMGFRVVGTTEDRVFIDPGRTNTLPWAKVETFLDRWLNHEPLQIYTTGNEAPASVIGLLVENGFDYNVHTNQQWIDTEWVDDPSLPWYSRNQPMDPEIANPAWTNKDFQLVVRIIPSGYSATREPVIGYFAGRQKTFTELKENVEWRARRRGGIQTNLWFYAAGGVLPGDVREMLEPLGIEYRVEDEKLLYRGKRY